VRRSEGNILYTVTLAAWLQGQPPEHWQVEALPEGLDNFLTQMWTRMWATEGDDRAEIETGLSLVMAAREALSRSRLMELAGWTQTEKAERFLRVARPFLLEEPRSRAWRPYHLSFRTFVVSQLARQVMRGAHRRLAEHLGAWPVKDPGDDFAKVYAARHAVDHWLEAGEPRAAATLCQDLSYLEALCQESGVKALQERLEEVARRVEQDEAERLRELARATQAESHWLAWQPEGLSRLVYNRLLSRGWTPAQFSEGLRFARGLLPSLRLRHPVQLGAGEDGSGGHLAGGGLGGRGGRGQRRGGAAGAREPDLRSLLHDQAAGAGDGARAVHLHRHRAAARRRAHPGAGSGRGAGGPLRVPAAGAGGPGYGHGAV